MGVFSRTVCGNHGSDGLDDVCAVGCEVLRGMSGIETIAEIFVVLSEQFDSREKVQEPQISRLPQDVGSLLLGLAPRPTY